MISLNTIQAQTVRMVSPPNENYYDPEFFSHTNTMVWSDDDRKLWYANIDTTDGTLISADGRDIYIDTIAPLAFTSNGGEFLLDASGWRIIYTGYDGNGLPQTFEAILQGATFQTNQLTIGPYPNAGAIASRNSSYTNGKIVYFTGTPNNNATINWSSIHTPQVANPIGTFEPGGSHVDFFPGNEFGISIVNKDSTGIYQLFTVDSLNTKSQLTASPFNKQNPMIVSAPEINNKMLVGCIEELPESDSLNFYRQINGQWVLFNKIGLASSPNDTIRMTSTEMFVWQNKSFVVAKVYRNNATQSLSEIWITDISGSIQIKMDNQNGQLLLTEPEYLVTQNKLFIYYTIRYGGLWELWVSELEAGILSSDEAFNNNNLSSVKVYPNPTTNDLRIESNFEIKRYQIYSSEGALINSINTESHGKNLNIDTSDLTQGIYLLRLERKDVSVKVVRFVKH